MKRKINLKTFIITGMLTVCLTLLGATNSKAALQSNPTTHASPAGKFGKDWIKEIRQMEAPGQTMGLNEQIDENLVETTPNNNIDVHMMKSTEYGALAILTISGFGNTKTISESTIKSSTGNVTGVYFSQGELVAAENANSYIKANAKYFNKYSSGYADGSLFIGDGLGASTWSKTPGAIIPNPEEPSWTNWSSAFGGGNPEGMYPFLRNVHQGLVRGVKGYYIFAGTEIDRRNLGWSRLL